MRPLLLCALTSLLMAFTLATARGAVPARCGLPGFVPVGGRPCPRALRGGSLPTAPRVRTGPRPPAPGATGAGPGATENPALFGIFGSIGNKILDTLVGWVADGAASALRYTAHLISETTAPDLESSWFSASYWRVAALATLLSVPFLCAAAVHALVRSDLGMLARAAFGYLPLAMIGVAIAAPLTTLVLSATDQMSTFVAGASGNADATFLARAATSVSAASVIAQDPFLAFFAGLVTVGATLSLWVELVIRAAAVEVIVLMLPLFFAAMVWPARRVWAIRAVETLFALILAKFAIVSVLALGGSAIAHAPSDGPVSLITGATLVMLAVLTPWALLRILPVHEIAAAAAGGLSAAPRAAVGSGAGQLLRGGSGAGSGEGSDAGGGESSNGGLGDPDSDIPRRLGQPRSVGAGSATAGRFSPPTTEELGAVEGDGSGAVERDGAGAVAARAGERGAVAAATQETEPTPGPRAEAIEPVAADLVPVPRGPSANRGGGSEAAPVSGPAPARGDVGPPVSAGVAADGAPSAHEATDTSSDPRGPLPAVFRPETKLRTFTAGLDGDFRRLDDLTAPVTDEPDPGTVTGPQPPGDESASIPHEPLEAVEPPAGEAS